jgi:hypothetical protein
MDRKAPRLELVPYSPQLDDAIVDFNRRLVAGSAEGGFQLLVGPGPTPAPGGEGVSFERYVALEGDTVRGGVTLQIQPFSVDGEMCMVANLQLPLSEGIVDRRYAFVGSWLVKHVLHRYPRCFALGMGGEDRQLPQLLRAMGFAVWSVPFLFMVSNVSRAVRELTVVGPPRRRRAAATLVRFSGAGLLASKGWRATTAWRAREADAVGIEPVEQWGLWADQVWERARGSFRVSAVRDARTMPTLLSPDDGRFPAFRLHERGETLGWVAVVVNRMVDNPHFGNLSVGTIVDALTVPGRERATVGAATRLLVEQDVDLVVTNQSHPVWRAACRSAGFLGGPSNYVLATSPRFLGRGVDLESSGVHFTRGDGDGRVHL